jgi:hypothetical protein
MAIFILSSPAQETAAYIRKTGCTAFAVLPRLLGNLTPERTLAPIFLLRCITENRSKIPKTDFVQCTIPALGATHHSRSGYTTFPPDASLCLPIMTYG